MNNLRNRGLPGSSIQLDWQAPLELKPEVELHGSRTAAAAELAERGRVDAGRQAGEERHVEGIEHVSPKLEINSFGEAKPLGQGEIRVPVSGQE
jgi:hypothetical protein